MATRTNQRETPMFGLNDEPSYGREKKKSSKILFGTIVTGALIGILSYVATDNPTTPPPRSLREAVAACDAIVRLDTSTYIDPFTLQTTDGIDSTTNGMQVEVLGNIIGPDGIAIPIGCAKRQ